MPVVKEPFAKQAARHGIQGEERHLQVDVDRRQLVRICAVLSALGKDGADYHRQLRLPYPLQLLNSRAAQQLSGAQLSVTKQSRKAPGELACELTSRKPNGLYRLAMMFQNDLAACNFC